MTMCTSVRLRPPNVEVSDSSERLINCNEDLVNHLQSCHLSKLIGNITEHELILARAGMFYVPVSEQDKM